MTKRFAPTFATYNASDDNALAAARTYAPPTPSRFVIPLEVQDVLANVRKERVYAPTRRRMATLADARTAEQYN